MNIYSAILYELSITASPSDRKESVPAKY